jgi:hypothetical protein
MKRLTFTLLKRTSGGTTRGSGTSRLAIVPTP